MINKLDIRKATPGDAESISKLVRELSVKYITPEFSAEGEKTLLDSMAPAAIERYMQTGYQYQVVETEGKIIGVVAIRDNKHLYHLFVAEDYHRMGIARSLWQAAMEHSLSQGNPGEFTVNSSTYALRVYAKLGFIAQEGSEEKGGVIYYPMKLEINN